MLEPLLNGNGNQNSTSQNIILTNNGTDIENANGNHHSDFITPTKANASTNTNHTRRSKAIPAAQTNGNSNGHSNGNSNGHSNGNSNGHTNGNSNGNSNGINGTNSSPITPSTSAGSTCLNGSSRPSKHQQLLSNGNTTTPSPTTTNNNSSPPTTTPTIMRNMDDKWILIQKSTFTNWVNEQLKAENESINDLKTDLSNGVRLIKLVNHLQQPSSKISRRFFRTPTNQHQCLENVSLALNAITEDGIKLVNIGNTDLANGNLKLILGLIWHLILRYQIGKTKIPPKKLILAWIKSVLPNYHLNNLTEDLNDGLIIAGLINFCNPNLFQDWLSWDKTNKLENCTKAMTTALKELEIPLVVTPLNMSSPELDELSAITYLSYFIREGSPGYRATLKWIQSIIQDEKINNFSTDWNDGWLLCKLAHKMGIQIEGYPNLDRTKREANCQKGLNACRKLKVEAYVSAKELSDPEVDSIAVMATVAQFKHAKPARPVSEKIKIYLLDSTGSGNSISVGQPFEFRLEYLEAETKNIKAVVKGPKTTPSVGVEKVRAGVLDCNFVPTEIGRFELNIICDDELVDGCPIVVNVRSDSQKVQLIVNEKSAFLNEPFEFSINPMGMTKTKIAVVSKTPSGKEITSSVDEKDSKFYAKLYPNEPGTWITRVFFNDSEIQGSPFTFEVYDLNQTEIEGLASINTSNCPLHKRINFKVNCTKIGGQSGIFNAQLILIASANQTNSKGASKVSGLEIFPIDISELDSTAGIYNVSFSFDEPGTYRCALMYNNKHIKGSPIDFNAVGGVVDMSQLMVDFHKCKSVLVNQNCTFNIDTKDNSGQGDVKVVITTPSGVHQPAKLTQQGHSWKVDFSPNEIGEYYVDVFYANQLITGSPFKCNVFDPTKIKVTPTLTGLVDQVVKFEVDASQAGTGQLEIAVENGRIPCNFSNQGNLRFVPSFTPREAGKHEVTIKFNQHDVPGSPFYCSVVDLSRVALVNLDQNAQLLFACFKTHHVELNSADLAPSLNVKLVAPSSLVLPISKSITPYNTIKIVFQPTEIGTHLLEVDYLGQHVVAGSPFELKVYDAARILVSDIRGNELNKPCELSIDATSAGEGQLEIAVNDGLVKNQVKPIKPGHYGVVFVPTKQDLYQVDIKFNNELVPGCPKQVYIKDHSSARLLTPMPAAPNDSPSAQLAQTAHFDLGGIHSLGDLSVRIRAPSGQEYTPKIQKLASSSAPDECRVEWIPYELGTYTIDVLYCEHIVKGCPIKVKTYDPKRVLVYNLQDGFVFKPNVFCVDAGQAGEGSLEIGISNSQGQYIPNQVKPLGNSKFEIQFLPQEAQMHYANISFNSEPVKGSPFPIKIIDTNLVVAQGKGLMATPINQQTSFSIIGCSSNSTLGSPATSTSTAAAAATAAGAQLKATVTGPKGELLYLKLYQQANGDYVGEYTPVSCGQHRVDVYYASQAIAGSPFLVPVFDPKLVDVIGGLPKELVVGHEASVEAEWGKCGGGSAIGVSLDLDLKVSGPGQCLNVVQENVAQSHRKFAFVPAEVGLYKVSLLIAGYHVASSPYTINCVDSKLPTAHGDGLHHGLEDKPAYFYVDAQGMPAGALEVNIEGPQHFTKNQIERQSDGSYIVKYTPVEVGLFKIFVKWNGREIPNSPFVSYVVNPDKVKIVGGWQSILDYHNVLNLKLYEERTINFDVSEAGPGTLNASILAPNGAKLPFRLINQSPIYSLTFTASQDGEYSIQVTWDNHALPNTPIVAKTSTPVPIIMSSQPAVTNTPQQQQQQQQFDLSKIEISGYGLQEAKINTEAEFIIDGSRALLNATAVSEPLPVPEIKLTGTRCDVDVRVVPIGHNVFRCVYVPQIPGAYLLNIKWNDRQVGDSPYKVNIGMNSDPSKVIVSGEGIKMGIFGQEMKALIDTRRAGPGELTAHCMGPQKVAFCEFFDHKDGTFTLFVKPQEPGKHVLQIKYNDEHVPGSPFVIKVSGPPDASKVRVFGPGISHGVLNKFKSKFVCETKGAGAGQLTVRIRGPKGAFRVEMQRESQKDRTIYCKFDPTESGDYQINVKWSGQHVPGSPFNVHIFNNDDELDQFLRVNPEASYAIQQQQLHHHLLNI